ncbi:MAG: TonB-dependent receptor, partial [Pseudomonadota bacterium]|nr:TonB-dependent receptor [Pseudomonadota bacterium]
MVLRPRFLPGLTAALDWYDIRLRDAINEASATEIAALCVDQASLDNIFCDAITRDPATGFVTSFVAGAQNVANFDTTGLDLTVQYRFTPAANLGDFNLRLVGGYLDKLTFISTPGAEPDDDRGEQFIPKYVATADLTWTQGPVALNYGLSWFGKTRRFTTEQLRGNPDLSDPRYFFFKERWEHDVQASYRFGTGASLYGGVNNLTDQRASVASGGSYPVSAVGRYFYVGAKFGLGR